MIRLLYVFLLLLSPLPLLAQMQVTAITPDTYALVGPLGNRDPQNKGNNSTHGLVVTAEGCILIDAGGSREGARAIHAVVQSITDQPVRFVINTGGQDHRWLGNGYWKEQGATVIASERAVADQAARASVQQSVLATLIGRENLAGTNPTFADITFAQWYDLTLGATTLQIFHVAGAHTPGDAFVWHPTAQTVFTGDIVYVQRMLGVLEVTDTVGWLKSFDAMAALNPQYVVPGHGQVTSLATATRDTRDYLINLRDKIRAHIDSGGDIIDSVGVDQSAFRYLENFETLARRNAQQAFSQMEWE
jgi:glyoxylase-like metal-dependent hydrolase (beta-lactamase superfamily II)